MGNPCINESSMEARGRHFDEGVWCGSLSRQTGQKPVGRQKKKVEQKGEEKKKRERERERGRE